MRSYLYLLSGYTLIAERYVLDTMTTVAYSIDDAAFLQSPLSKLFMILIPKRTKFIFIDADYDTVFKRRAPLLENGKFLAKSEKVYGSIPRSAVEPQDFIDFQRQMYCTLAKSTNALSINSSQHSIKETFDIIMRYLTDQPVSQ